MCYKGSLNEDIDIKHETQKSFVVKINTNKGKWEHRILFKQIKKL